MVIPVENYSAGDGYTGELVQRVPDMLHIGYEDYLRFLGSYPVKGPRNRIQFPEGPYDGRTAADTMFENLLYHHEQLVELAGEFRDVPVAANHHAHHKELERIVIKPLRELLEKKLPQPPTPSEYARIAHKVASVYLYHCYQYGHGFIANEAVKSDNGLEEVISPFRLVSEEFCTKWGGHFGCGPAVRAKRNLGVLTLYVLDSFGSKILVDVLEHQNPRLLHQKCPDYGVQRVIFGENAWWENAITNRMKEMFEKEELTKLAPTAILRQRASKKRFWDYLREIYPEKGRQTRTQAKTSPQQEQYLA